MGWSLWLACLLSCVAETLKNQLHYSIQHAVLRRCLCPTSLKRKRHASHKLLRANLAPDVFMSKLQPRSCEERWREVDARAKKKGAVNTSGLVWGHISIHRGQIQHVFKRTVHQRWKCCNLLTLMLIQTCRTGLSSVEHTKYILINILVILFHAIIMNQHTCFQAPKRM